MEKIVLILISALGLCVGSFCNVLIVRIPEGEEFVKTPSHCTHCGHVLRWYENIPLVSFLLQRGRCRACSRKISLQYPAVEAANGLLWLACGLCFWGEWLSMLLYCCLVSLCTVIALIDLRCFEIPNGLNLAIFILGLVRVFSDLGNWKGYAAGAVCVSFLFLLIWLLTGGRGIGMGDVKLMAAAGLLLGWQKIILALMLGSIAGSIIHLARMSRKTADRLLAFGPYLSAGIVISALFGETVTETYLGLWGL